MLGVVYQFNEENTHTGVRNLKLNCFRAENGQNNYKHGDVERYKPNASIFQQHPDS